MKALVSLRQKSNNQLNDRLNEIAISLRRVSAKNSAARETSASAGQGTNTMYIGNLKKQRARILTILQERKTKQV